MKIKFQEKADHYFQEKSKETKQKYKHERLRMLLNTINIYDREI